MMPHRMKPTLRVAAALFAMSVAAIACTGSGTGGGGSVTPSATASSSPVATITGPPGALIYHYTNTGLSATLQLEGDKGTLTIQNATGRELAPPGLYVLDARDGKRIDGKVDAPAGVPDGQTKAFRVSFTGLEDKNIGLVVLMIGPDNYGAFVRQQ
jgi:hypothetical protein